MLLLTSHPMHRTAFGRISSNVSLFIYFILEAYSLVVAESPWAFLNSVAQPCTYAGPSSRLWSMSKPLSHEERKTCLLHFKVPSDWLVKLCAGSCVWGPRMLQAGVGAPRLASRMQISETMPDLHLLPGGHTVSVLL